MSEQIAKLNIEEKLIACIEMAQKRQDDIRALRAENARLKDALAQRDGLQQRVDQLEGELSTPTWVCDGCGRVSSEGWINIVSETPDGIDYDMECPSCGVRQIEEDSAADLVRELERREDQLTTLQDDHARVLGLVRDFVAAWDHDGEPDAMSYETAVDKARPYLASLPAPPAQGARCDQCGTRLAHEDHKYDCPYMIVKRQHAEGETRA